MKPSAKAGKEEGHVAHLNGSSFKEIIAKDRPVLIDFWADWCAPCHMMTPIVEALAGKYDGKVAFAKVNVDENSSIAVEYGITAIPTFIIFKNGKFLDVVVGAVGEEGLEAMLKKAL